MTGKIIAIRGMRRSDDYSAGAISNSRRFTNANSTTKKSANRSANGSEKGLTRCSQR